MFVFFSGLLNLPSFTFSFVSFCFTFPFSLNSEHRTGSYDILKTDKASSCRIIISLSCVELVPNHFCPRRHVQINNESAINFYKKFGFEIISTEEHYYKRIEPANAHVLAKSLKRPADAK